LFGAILCATDPVSVVSLLKSSGASSKLTIVIVGESLLNDGSAMLLFFYFIGLVEGSSYTATAVVEFVCIKLFVSPLCGLVIGFIAVLIMKRLYQNWHITDMKVQVAITLIATYSSFFIAQYGQLIDGSGVLSCCSAGCIVAWMASPKILSDDLMKEVWHTLEWVCNTLIFLLGGLIAGGKTLQTATLNQAGFAVIIYLMLMGLRCFLMACFYPVVSRIGVKCSVNDALFMAFSGIRGALAIALALQVKSNSAVTEDNGEQFYFFVCAVAALSLLLNGTFAEPLLQFLKLVEAPGQSKSPEYKFVLEQIKRRIRRGVRAEMETLKEELGGFDDEEVSRLCRMHRGSHFGGEGDHYQVNVRNTSRISKDLLGFVRTTFLETVRARYWSSIKSGKIGTQSFSAQLLLYSVDKALDLVSIPTSTLGDWECIERNLSPDKHIMWLATNIDACAGRFGRFPGLVSYIDAYTERRAIYVLSNFIDAHVHAQNRIHMFLGAPEKGYGDPCPEEASVIHDSEASVARAKYLLRLIKQDDLKEFYNHRAARVVLLLQQQLIDHMVEEGALSHQLAEMFLESIDEDHQDLDREREQTHRYVNHYELKSAY
jgi:NhaP-type Na+/H+ or K+/H+ antiporter